jgi:hypothetical protein
MLAGGAAAFLLVYAILEGSGLFRVTPAGVRDIAISLPFLLGSLVLLAALLVNGWQRRRVGLSPGWFSIFAGALIVAGLWTSHLTRFSAEIPLSEGQKFSSLGQVYPAESLLVGPLTRQPQIVVALKKLSPTFATDRQRLTSLQGEVSFALAGGGPRRTVSVTDRFPTFIAGMRLQLRDFGYSPRYLLKDRSGRVLDSAWAALRLFPPGSEDSFRLITPHTFSLRYSPAPDSAGGKPFQLRIVRGKDLLFTGSVGLGGEVPFDNGFLAIAEVRNWTRLVVVRDWGEPLTWGGILLLAVSGATRWWLARKSASGKGSTKAS